MKKMTKKIELKRFFVRERNAFGQNYDIRRKRNELSNKSIDGINSTSPFVCSKTPQQRRKNFKQLSKAVSTPKMMPKIYIESNWRHHAHNHHRHHHHQHNHHRPETQRIQNKINQMTPKNYITPFQLISLLMLLLCCFFFVHLSEQYEITEPLLRQSKLTSAVESSSWSSSSSLADLRLESHSNVNKSFPSKFKANNRIRRFAYWRPNKNLLNRSSYLSPPPSPPFSSSSFLTTNKLRDRISLIGRQFYKPFKPPSASSASSSSSSSRQSSPSMIGAYHRRLSQFVLHQLNNLGNKLRNNTARSMSFNNSSSDITISDEETKISNNSNVNSINQTTTIATTTIVNDTSATVAGDKSVRRNDDIEKWDNQIDDDFVKNNVENQNPISPIDDDIHARVASPSAAPPSSYVSPTLNVIDLEPDKTKIAHNILVVRDNNNKLANSPQNNKKVIQIPFKTKPPIPAPVIVSTQIKKINSNDNGGSTTASDFAPPSVYQNGAISGVDEDTGDEETILEFRPFRNNHSPQKFMSLAMWALKNKEKIISPSSSTTTTTTPVSISKTTTVTTEKSTLKTYKTTTTSTTAKPLTYSNIFFTSTLAALPLFTSNSIRSKATSIKPSLQRASSSATPSPLRTTTAFLHANNNLNRRQPTSSSSPSSPMQFDTPTTRKHVTTPAQSKTTAKISITKITTTTSAPSTSSSTKSMTLMQDAFWNNFNVAVANENKTPLTKVSSGEVVADVANAEQANEEIFTPMVTEFDLPVTHPTEAASSFAVIDANEITQSSEKIMPNASAYPSHQNNRDETQPVAAAAAVAAWSSGKFDSNITSEARRTTTLMVDWPMMNGDGADGTTTKFASTTDATIQDNSIELLKEYQQLQQQQQLLQIKPQQIENAAIANNKANLYLDNGHDHQHSHNPHNPSPPPRHHHHHHHHHPNSHSQEKPSPKPITIKPQSVDNNRPIENADGVVIFKNNHGRHRPRPSSSTSRFPTIPITTSKFGFNAITAKPPYVTDFLHPTTISVRRQPAITVTNIAATRIKQPDEVQSASLMVLDPPFVPNRFMTLPLNTTIVHRNILVPMKEGRPKPSYPSRPTTQYPVLPVVAGVSNWQQKTTPWATPIITTSSPINLDLQAAAASVTSSIYDHEDFKLETTTSAATTAYPTTKTVVKVISIIPAGEAGSFDHSIDRITFSQHNRTRIPVTSTTTTTTTTTTRRPSIMTETKSTTTRAPIRHPSYPVATAAGYVNAIYAPPMPIFPSSSTGLHFSPNQISSSWLRSLSNILTMLTPSQSAAVSFLSVLRSALYSLMVVLLPPLALMTAFTFT